MKELRSYFDDIGSSNKYIGVTLKMDDETNSVSNIATVKWRDTYANIFATVWLHNNPLLDTWEY